MQSVVILEEQIRQSIFLFDFDLEQMLKDNVYLSSSRGKQYITKWWKGEIRHWTVNDGIWKE